MLGSFPKVSPYTRLQQAIPRNQRKRSLHRKGVCACYVSKSFLTLCGESPPGSSVRGILQARILDWVAISSFRGSSWPKDRTHISGVSRIAGDSFLLSYLGIPSHGFDLHLIGLNLEMRMHVAKSTHMWAQGQEGELKRHPKKVSKASATDWTEHHEIYQAQM